jgi:DNA-binding CsgD family transcriptional regulator
MIRPVSGQGLVARETECARIESLIDAARRGESGSIVVTGEPGVGKTALLRHAAASATGLRVLRTEGVEPEADLPFAGLHRLLLPVAGMLDSVSSVQADALRGALGLGPGRGERLLVGAGVLSLLAEAAERDGGLICLVDDAQWLDRESAEALTFAARRLDAEGVVLIFAAREADGFRPPGIERMPLPGLGPDAAATLLRRAGLEAAPAVVERLVGACDGNALALLETAAGLAPAQRGGVRPLPAELPMGERIREALLARVESLPEPTRRLLLLAAIEPSASIGVLAEAAAELGLDLSALEPAEEAGVVEVHVSGVRFTSPLLRSAVESHAPFVRRRAAHAALATALAAERPDRWAWHRAAIADGPDPVLADELERSAERARARSGFAATASALERSADLTSDRPKRERRLVAAATAAWEAGLTDRAAALLTKVEKLEPGDVNRARATALRGVMETHLGRPAAAVPVLRDAATALAVDDPEAATEALICAVEAAAIAGDFSHLAPLADLAESLMHGPAMPISGLLRGMAWITRGDPARASEPLRRFTEHVAETGDARRIAWGAIAALYRGDTAEALRLYDRAVDRARRTGMLTMLPWLLENRALLESAAGEVALAEADATEALRLATELALPRSPVLALATLVNVAGFRGDTEEFAARRARALEAAERHGLGITVGLVRAMELELALGQGRVDDAARRAAELARAGADLHPMIPIVTTPDRTEALVRSGRSMPAGELAVYQAWTAASDGAHHAPLVARCRALTAAPEDADRHFRDALDLYESVDRPYDEARTRLLFGEHLRRRRQVSQAREQLRTAVETFGRLGCRLWAERARAELRAAGESIGPADVDAFAELTAQELQIVRLVGQGMSNRQVAGQLFLSPRTVEYHLYKVYPKLGITSRVELIRTAAARLGERAS